VVVSSRNSFLLSLRPEIATGTRRKACWDRAKRPAGWKLAERLDRKRVASCVCAAGVAAGSRRSVSASRALAPSAGTRAGLDEIGGAAAGSEWMGFAVACGHEGLRGTEIVSMAGAGRGAPSKAAGFWREGFSPGYEAASAQSASAEGGGICTGGTGLDSRVSTEGSSQFCGRSAGVQLCVRGRERKSTAAPRQATVALATRSATGLKSWATVMDWVVNSAPESAIAISGLACGAPGGRAPSLTSESC